MNCHGYSWEKKRKKKRGAAASLLSFRRNIGKEGMSHQLMWEPHGPLPVCICFWSGKKPDRDRNTDGGLQGVISWQNESSCLLITTLSFLLNIQPHSAHSPRLSSWHPLPLQGSSKLTYCRETHRNVICVYVWENTTTHRLHSRSCYRVLVTVRPQKRAIQAFPELLSEK